MNKEEILNSIFESDSLGILEVKAKNPVISADDRLIESFEEINEFYKIHNKKPQRSSNMNERKLFSRLNGIKQNPSKVQTLKKYDKYNLLEDTKKTIQISSIDDIFNDDSFDILSSSDEDIFTLKNIPKQKETTMPDYVASRKSCKDFDKYEHLFIKVQKELKAGTRKIIKFQNEKQIKKGYYFILKGVLLYVADVGKQIKSSGKTNARLKLIFENATESNMLLRSLAAELYKDGKRVSEYDETQLKGLYEINKDDKQNGYIYILKSLSTDDRIITKKNLYKIGFSTTLVENRIKNAKDDPTYLMAEVKIVAAYEVYNVNAHKLEQLIHKFFGNSCLDIDIIGNNTKIHRPREWFIVPLDVIQEAIELIINGKIIDYKYDDISERIVKK